MDLKALVLAGGRGKRLENVTAEINKCMLPFSGKPLITYSLENAVRAGVREIVIVVGYRAEDIINHFGVDFNGTRIKYVIQKEQKGLVHAIECAADAIGRSDFMTYLGDEVLIHPRHEQMVNLFQSGTIFAVCGVTEVQDKKVISHTYAIIQDNDASIFRLIEKPRNPINHIMGTGNCIFRNEIFNYIAYTPINHIRNEKELPDLIQCAIDEGRMVKSFNIGSGYININTEEDVSQAEEMFEKLYKDGEK